MHYFEDIVCSYYTCLFKLDIVNYYDKPTITIVLRVINVLQSKSKLKTMTNNTNKFSEKSSLNVAIYN